MLTCARLSGDDARSDILGVPSVVNNKTWDSLEHCALCSRVFAARRFQESTPSTQQCRVSKMLSCPSGAANTAPFTESVIELLFSALLFIG